MCFVYRRGLLNETKDTTTFIMVVVSDDDVFFSVMFYEKRSTDMKENFPPIGSTKKLRKKWRQKIATTQKP